MNYFLYNAKEVCENLLPILGVIALIVVIIFLIELIKTLKNANVTLKSSTDTIDQVNDSIKKVQAPLDAVVKVSGTIDKAHDATLKGIEDAKDYVSKNAKVIKDKVNDFISKESQEDENKEPSPEDIIGGK